MESLELLILQELVYNEEYYEKVIPFLNSDMFEKYGYKNLLNIIVINYKKHHKRTTPELLLVGVNYLETKGLTEDQDREIRLAYEKTTGPRKEQPIEILLSETEKYLRSRITY